MDKSHNLSQRRQIKHTELPPSVAAAMVYLSEPDASDIFLDPFSADGLFLMERRLAGPYQQMWGLAPNRTAYKLAQTNLQKQRKEAPQNTRIEKQDFTGLHIGVKIDDKSGGRFNRNRTVEYGF